MRGCDGGVRGCVGGVGACVEGLTEEYLKSTSQEVLTIEQKPS